MDDQIDDGHQEQGLDDQVALALQESARMEPSSGAKRVPEHMDGLLGVGERQLGLLVDPIHNVIYRLRHAAMAASGLAKTPSQLVGRDAFLFQHAAQVARSYGSLAMRSPLVGHWRCCTHVLSVADLIDADADKNAEHGAAG